MSCTFCPLPWNSINLRNNGDLRICCNTNSYSPQRGIMKKEDGTPYNAGKDDWNEARNAELVKEVRVSMMNGVQNVLVVKKKKKVAMEVVVIMKTRTGVKITVI
jgi:hypothetical protein